MKETPVSYDEIIGALEASPPLAIDHVLGIARGGTILSLIVATFYRKPWSQIRVSHRNDDKTIRFVEPRILSGVDEIPSASRVLVVDDVSVTGKTILTVKEHLELAGRTVVTMGFKGALLDVTLTPNATSCVRPPWC
jgi:hypoxanthine phosphoribosyltransferase